VRSVAVEAPAGRSGKKGPVLVWLFILSYWTLTSFFGRASSVSQLPSAISISMWVTFIAGQLLEYAPVLLFLFLFVWIYERRERSGGIRSLFSSVGWNRNGLGKSLKWALVFLLIVAPISIVLSSVESSVSVGTGSSSTQPAMTSIPLAALIIIVISAFATAVTEETAVRGYILDRLMPAHPSTLRLSLNAVIIASVMQTSYHAASYINTYGYSLPVTVVGLVSVFVYSIFLSFAYVRSRARNASGPILFHFLLDAGFYIVLFGIVG
jgi:membrane protease YdiL (CAAX protease family)